MEKVAPSVLQKNLFPNLTVCSCITNDSCIAHFIIGQRRENRITRAIHSEQTPNSLQYNQGWDAEEMSFTDRILSNVPCLYKRK